MRAEVLTEASVRLAESLQPESRPASRPARPREAILMRFRLVREAGRKCMSYAPRWSISGARIEARVPGGIKGDNDTFVGGGFEVGMGALDSGLPFSGLIIKG